MSQHPIRDAHILAAHDAVTAPGFGNDLMFTIQETAQLLKVTNRTIRNLVHHGKLRAIYLMGVQRIPRSEVERLAQWGTGDRNIAQTEEAARKGERRDRQRGRRQAARRPDLHTFIVDAKRKVIGHTNGGLPVVAANERELVLMDNNRSPQRWTAPAPAPATTEVNDNV